MHLPDGLIWPPIMALGWILAIVIITIAVRRVKGSIPSERMPTMAVLAAGIFVAQMLNFPIAGGTTGHLIGATIATLIVGPWAAIIVMSVIIIVQGLMFGDGGILALGLNLTNMAIVGVAVSWIVIKGAGRFKMEISTFVAAWLAVLAAATICAIELAISYAAAPDAYGIIWSISIPTMVGLHAMIGLGEGIITSSVMAYVLRVSPEIVQTSHRRVEAIAQ